MSLLLFKVLAALIILLTSLAAGIGPLRKSYAQPEYGFLELGEALGGGIFLGIAFFHMLPDAQADLQSVYGATKYPYANLLCVLGFVILLFLEKVLLHVSDEQALNKPRSIVPYVLPLVLSVHALMEGAALGINIEVADAIVIFIAIMVHKGSESLALATNLGRSYLPFKRSMLIFLFWALISPLGVLMGSMLAHHLQSRTGLITAAVFNALAAGSFIYIATLHKTTQLCKSKHTDYFMEFIFWVMGLGLMAVVEVWL